MENDKLLANLDKIITMRELFDSITPEPESIAAQTTRWLRFARKAFPRMVECARVKSPCCGHVSDFQCEHQLAREALAELGIE